MFTHTRFVVAACVTSSLLFLAGCSPKQVAPYSGNGNGSSQVPPQESTQPTMGTITEEMLPAVESLDATGEGTSGSFAEGMDQQSEAYKRAYGRSTPNFKPIYFDYDQSLVRGDQIPTMEYNGSYLRDTPGSRVLIEGNTDARGTNEYNLALGERRAASAKKYLIEFGIETSRIRTVSYGEERPLFPGTGKDDYAQNRRDDFILE
ncbi:OmpA family protein [Desulfobulbus rhabdoformis]|jgi:peptidoglycan-associated lipoprotein|uniref:OmpA family protein n=1 Tax=Desulfobulbus rhabdoformis TaxID=34032 RepID=UPI001965DACE|nr:OmpA family protein [Desulfobulbus rhabdoformis]MBM9613116.1 OmpA family protein [Desulfobulbus rhabdoformis]